MLLDHPGLMVDLVDHQVPGGPSRTPSSQGSDSFLRLSCDGQVGGPLKVDGLSMGPSGRGRVFYFWPSSDG